MPTATSPGIKFDNTGFTDVRAEGRGRTSAWPMRVPLRLQARTVTGVGDVAGAILANVRLEGMLNVTSRFVRGDGLDLTSDKLRGKVSLLFDLSTGRFEVLVSGGMTRYLIPGLGIVDVKTASGRPGREWQARGHRQRMPGSRVSTTASSAT